MQRITLLLSAAMLVAINTASPVLARLGVGVSLGKIEVEERLRPGGIYNLPPISVFNTGDETADYAMTVTFHEGQAEKRPKAEWFHYSPDKFQLGAGQSQTVEVELHMPIRVEPGDYFAYLEAGPLQTVESGESTIGLAAATKLSFSVDPANVWWALYYKGLALWRQYAPWTYVGLGVLSAAVVLIVLRGRFRIRPRRIKLAHEKVTINKTR